MRCLTIGDVHLKPKLFDMADHILESGQADIAIQMGDLVDDWGEEFNIGLYERTLKRAIKFRHDHPGSLWVLGNHCYGYLSSYGSRESGHSVMAEPFVRPLLSKLPQRVMHIVDGVIFTHAGLTREWVERQLSLAGLDEAHLTEKDFVPLVNMAAPDELWLESSPIWARPQIDEYEMWPAKLQVVGHTPVKELGVYNGCLSTDTFSTYRNGAPYGDQKFAIIDTDTGEWKIAKEEL